MSEPSRALRRWVRILVTLGVLLSGAAAAGILFVYWTFLRDLPDFDSLADYRPSLTTVVLDREGRRIGELYEHRRRTTEIEGLPPYVIQAFIAAEDGKFYEHDGIDFPSILRAAWTNLRAGGQTRQGASTITQQMVKQLLLTPERTYRRKIREMILARRIEQRFSKDEILYLYLNEIYFGAGAYGIGEAAYTYFGKSPEQIDVAEAALLAGLPKAPGRNSPYQDPERAEARRRYVLERMHEERFIDDAELAAARERIPTLSPPPEREHYAAAAYFTEEVRRHLTERLGSELVLRGGLVIETTLDLDLQRAAVDAVRGGLESLDQRQGFRGPLRHVAAGELEAEIARLAESNGLAPEDGDEPDEAAALPEGALLTGVVLAIGGRGQHADVAFAPGLEGRVRLEDSEWARRVDRENTRKPSSLAKVFEPGDVALFERMEGEAGGRPLVRLRQRPEAQGALLSFDLGTGDLLALVGGYDFAESEFDRATQARRQPGSAFKPLIYAAAIEAGYTPASIVYDRPVIYDDPESGFTWRPENYGRRFLGPLTLDAALARSVNNATIHLLRDVGVQRVIDLSRRLRIEAPLEANLSLALGASSVSLFELTRAYGAFPSGGRLVEPVFIRRVLDRDGGLLLENVTLAEAVGDPDQPEAPAAVSAGAASSRAPRPVAPDSERVMKPTDAYLTTELLRGVVQHPRGTGRRTRALRRPVGGKTGTTNEQGDAWYIGFSPDVATGVWVGFDEKRVLGRGETGGRAALPIWLDYMGTALASRPRHDFDVPEGIVFARIDRETGLLATSSTEDAFFQAFLEGTEPTETADTARAAADSRRRLRLDF